MARGDSATSLAPGFRFHPTDEELIRYYLKRKVTNKPFRFDPISVVDIYKTEPWDLPGMSKLKSRDLEWYFFSALDKKYSNGSKTNRATEKGYWKTTGKDRPVRSGPRTVGMKKTLVYHLGRAPRGERSNWVMHEYRLADEELEKSGVSQDAYVLCRIFQKSGTGPKNGEQYGAPFVEEEWDHDDEEVAFLPWQETSVAAEEVTLGDDAYVEANDLDQNNDTEIEAENPAVPMPFYYDDSSNYVEHPRNFNEDDQKPMIGEGEPQYIQELTDDKNYADLPGQYEMDTKPLQLHYVAESSSNVNADGVDFLLDEPYLDATDNPQFGEGFFLEANDLSNPREPDSGDSTKFDAFEDYLNFFDANDANLSFDPSEILGSEDSVSDNMPLPHNDVNERTEDASMASPYLSEQLGNIDASSSQQMPEPKKFDSDVKYPFLKQASHMLGSIHAPSALASEFPMKDAALRLNAAQASSSVHVTAGMIRIENMRLGGNGLDWSFGKNGTVNIILSFGLSVGDVSNPRSVPMANLSAGKTGSVASRGWFYLMMLWVLILSLSYKIGTYVCAK